VQIIDTSNGVVIQQWRCCYGTIYFMAEVVCDIHHFIVVAARVSADPGSSIIVVLNSSSLMVVKLIFFPDEVSCLTSLTSDREFNVSDVLKSSDGILAVGSYGGKVYLIGLNLSQSFNRRRMRHPVSIKLIDSLSQEESFHHEHLALLLFQGNT
jgi:hypothetical protein